MSSQELKSRVSREPSEPIQPCSVCGTPPAASVQVGTGTTVFWFECKTCGKKSAVLASFEEARESWSALQ
jgi:ribosomal protein S14